MVALRKFTNMHSIMLTGHVMFQQSAVVVPVVYFLIFYQKNVAINIDQIIAIILISSLILGLYWSVGTTTTIKGADKITNNAGFAVGHQQMLGLFIAYGLGNFLEMPKIQLKLKK